MNATMRRAIAKRLLSGDVPLVGARHATAAARAATRRTCQGCGFSIYFRGEVPSDVRAICVVCIAEVEQEVEEIGARDRMRFARRARRSSVREVA